MKRLRSILHLLSLWVLVHTNVAVLHAFSPVTQPEQDVWPQAPQAYKFNEVKMPTPDLATGAVNLSIPLYTIQAEDLSIPLELRYRSNGIRVDDDPYPVGYGWTFTPSLRITRTVLGRPDGKYEFVGDRSPSDIDHATAHRCMVNKSFLGKSTGLDAERDIFTINLAGISFNGILEDGVIRTPGHEEYKVKAASDLSSITVTDPFGNIWKYSEIGAKWMTDDPIEWGLTSIKLTSGRLLQFTWTYGMHGPTGGGAYHSYDAFYSYSSGVNCNYDSWNGDRNIQQSPSGISLNLTKVTFPGGSVSLSYTGGKTAEFLETISVRDSSGREVRNISFAYGDSRVDDKMLTSVSFSGGEKWTFEYNPETFSANDSQDYWGYYNRKENRQCSAPTMRLTDPEYGPQGVNIDGSDRSPSEQYMKARILTGVTYPTGGRLKLEYEAHRFEPDSTNCYEVQLDSDPVLYFGGGLRLSSMTLSEGSDDLDPQRVEYRYGTDGNGLANADALPVASTFLNKGIFIAEPPWSGNSGTQSRPPTMKHGMVSANLHSCISDYRFGEDLIWYPEVTEIYSEGKRVHRFDKPEPNNVNLEYMGGAVPVTLNSVFASSIYETEALIYSGVDGSYRLVEKEENSYSGVTEGTGSSGLLIRRKEMQGLGAPTTPDFDESLSVSAILYNGMEQNSVSYSYNEGQIYSVNSYYISPTVIRLDERIVTTYTAEGDSIRQSEAYEYVRGTGLISAKTVSRGGHNRFRTEYSYTEGQSQAIAMKNANVVGVVTGVKERYGDCSWETRADYTRVGTASRSLFRTQSIRTRRGTDASAWRTLKKYTWNDKVSTDADAKIFGTLASATDPAGIKTEWTWDSSGLYPIAQKTGNLLTSRAEWKPLVGVKSLTDPSGLKEEYLYDSVGRLSLVSLRGRRMCEYEYSIRSNIPHSPNSVITRKYLGQSKSVGTKTIFDGLGRGTLDVTMQTSGASAVLTEYDRMGRPSKVWAAAPVSDLSPTESETKSAAASRYGTSNAFATTTYEASLRSLVLATNKAGDPWQSEGRSVTTRIRTNTYESGERFCMSYRILEDGLRPNGPRTAGAIRIERTVDEDGIVTETFTDMRGLKVAERHGEGVTAYVYDDYGDLRYILPPGAEAGGSRSSVTMKELAYWFDYDDYGRCVLRKAPGMAEEKMVYDPADRMVAMHSRDHADGVWRLFFYDGCGREVMVLDATISDAEAMSLGNACHTATFKGPEGEVQDFSITPTLEINLANAEVVTQRFYDTYYFREALGLKDYGFKPLGVEYGSSTGKLTGLFNGEGYEVYYYNPFGLECQRVASGFNVGRRTTKYNFDLSVSKVHTTYDGLYPDRNVYYSYDDCGRRTQMLVTEHRTREGVAHTDSATIKYEYGPTGLMEAVVMGPSRKKITYDIHGWQVKAETELKRSYDGNYVERLYYADTKAAHPRYNGFVSCKEWQRHAYDYEYDANGFLKKAVYSELPGNTQATGANQGVRFDRSVSFEYDVRGNVKKIQRKGAIDRHPSGKLIFGLLDDIEAAYTGNRLTGYSYQSGIPDATFGRNRVSGITELYDRREDFSGSLTDISDDSFTVNYKLGYDASGRLTGDTSRGVKDAQYDNNGYLTEVTVGGCSVKYRRDGLGNLLSAEYTTPDGSGKDVKGDMSDRYVLYDGDGHMAVNGTLEMSRFEGGYFDADGKPHYYLTDYQGNVVRVIDETGLGGQPMDYYPYGEPWEEWDWARADTYPNFIKNRFLYGGKERITQFGLGLYNFEARMYRAQLGRFSTPDKKAIDTPWLSPFAYCACNPVNAIDPTGNSTMVKRADDGKYEVLGGDLNDKDRNIYVYSQDKDGNYTMKGESIGVTTSTTSFYNSDTGQWGGTIDPGDTSGQEFLSDIMNNPPTLDEYMANARNNKQYDFKKTNGTTVSDNSLEIYRGMPIDKTSDGQTIYTSARDVGNIAAGYMAAINGLPWKVARLGFDGYQSYTSKALKREGISTQNAEKYGWEIGWNKTTFVTKGNNLFNSTKSFIKNMKLF